jgi:hypothetical protein
MSNMSYCRFRNTLGDLEDCYESLDDLRNGCGQLSDDELCAAKRLLGLCVKIADEFGSADIDALSAAAEEGRWKF